MSSYAMIAAAAAPTDPHNFTGIVGFGVSLMYGIGEWGLGVFTFLETVFPPIPSELILPLAGFLTHNNGMNYGLLVLTSTLGATPGPFSCTRWVAGPASTAPSAGCHDCPS